MPPGRRKKNIACLPPATATIMASMLSTLPGAGHRHAWEISAHFCLKASISQGIPALPLPLPSLKKKDLDGDLGMVVAGQGICLSIHSMAGRDRTGTSHIPSEGRTSLAHPVKLLNNRQATHAWLGPLGGGDFGRGFSAAHRHSLLHAFCLYALNNSSY